MDFHHVKIKSRPLLAVPSSDQLPQSACVACYPVHTWKKKFVRAAVGLIFATGLARWVWPRRAVQVPGIDGKEFERWLDEVRKDLGRDDLHPVLVWPADPNRGRLYLYLLNERGEKQAFCKMALDTRNSLLIAREREALKRLHALDLTRSQLPDVLASGLVGDLEYLVVSMTPSSARITDWGKDQSIDDVIAEYRGEVRELRGESLTSLDWWPAVAERFSAGSSFRRVIDEAVQDGISVCRVHGDLNQTNILRDGEKIWLLDWEQSHEKGPALTDQVCASVDQFWLENPNDPEGNLQKFKNRFLSESDKKARHAVVLALAYLGAARFPPALKMIDTWYPEN